MGKVAVRDFERCELDKVLGIYAHVFSRTWAEQFRDRWRWSQEENPFPQDTHRWVLVDGDAVIGFLATIPQMYSFNGQQILAHAPSDFLVIPEYRFHGLQLMNTFAKRCPNCITCDDISATVGINRWLKIESVASFCSFVLPLGLRAIWWELRTVPAPYLILAALKAQRRPARLEPAIQVAVQSGFDSRFDSFARELATRLPAMLFKDHRYLRWRYGPASPHAGARVFIVPDGPEKLAGYAVAYCERDGGPSGIVMDLQTRPRDERTMHALVAALVSYFRRRRVATVRYECIRSPSDPMWEVLKSHGFLKRLPLLDLRLMLRLASPDQMSVAVRPDNWSLNFGDTENSHSKFA